MNSLRLAWRYIAFHRWSSSALIAALALALMLPLATRWTIERMRVRALARADQTPLLIGAKGSSFALVLHGLYFRGDAPPGLTYGQKQRLDKYDLAPTLPILARYRARDHLIAGVTDEYLAFRKLMLAQGEPLERWGDCLVGWRAAQEMEVAVGEKLLTESSALLDLSGPAPLNLRVRGVLARTGTADDDVIFCHLETAWIIAGIGHGHTVTSEERTDEPPSKDADGTHHHAAENTQHYSEITEQNLSGFHFHGQRSDYPLTALIAVPGSVRSATLLEGKFLEPDEPCQIVSPQAVVSELLQIVARLQQLLDVVSLVLGGITLLLMALVVFLSLKLRARELATLRLLGASRAAVAGIVIAELAIILSASVLLALALAATIAVSVGSQF